MLLTLHALNIKERRFKASYSCFTGACGFQIWHIFKSQNLKLSREREDNEKISFANKGLC